MVKGTKTEMLRGTKDGNGKGTNWMKMVKINLGWKW